MSLVANCCSIVELREYTLHPGKRDDLIDLFDREFVESQEVLGVHVIGQFRDVDRPDRFVWLRGFPDMDLRLASLTSFYSGPVWDAHKDAANATMVDSDNVLLLRPTRDGSGFAHPPRRTRDELPTASHAFSISVVARDESFEAVGDGGGLLLAKLESEPSANTYPRLPIREGEDVVVTVRRHSTVDEIDPVHTAAALTMRLTPTSRSELA
jgi:hypothetical protein